MFEAIFFVNLNLNKKETVQICDYFNLKLGLNLRLDLKS